MLGETASPCAGHGHVGFGLQGICQLDKMRGGAFSVDLCDVERHRRAFSVYSVEQLPVYCVKIAFCGLLVRTTTGWAWSSWRQYHAHDGCADMQEGVRYCGPRRASLSFVAAAATDNQVPLALRNCLFRFSNISHQ